MKRFSVIAASTIMAIGLVGCTEPGEMTGIGAATGGAIGAGLGAIVGSQTGSAGTGLVIGAAGGAAAGAAVGNALQAQDETMRSQDEAIERQQAMLAANQRELNVLRGVGDSPSATTSAQNHTFPSRYEPPTRGGVRRDFSSPSHSSARASYPVQRDITQRDLTQRPSEAGFRETTNSYAAAKRSDAARLAPRTESARELSRTTAAVKAPPAPKLKSGEIEERDLVAAPVEPAHEAVAAKIEAPDAMLNETEIAEKVAEERAAEQIIAAPIVEVPSQAAKVVDTGELSDDCKRAAGEVIKGNDSREIADRLFHYRRALRLCPNNAEYHNLLGETYISLNRTVDAEFEFREALKINPNLEQAKSNLAALR